MGYDRRKKKLCYMKIALVGFIVAWAALGVAVAQGSLSEHATEITVGQWYLIVGLVGLVELTHVLPRVSRNFVPGRLVLCSGFHLFSKLCLTGCFKFNSMTAVII